MRDVRPSITAAWRAGDFTGPRRPMARVTVQQAKVTLHPTTNNLFACLPFGATEAPKELPNVKQVSWDRSTDAEIASCNLDFYNVRALPLGTVGSVDHDRPGYFTFGRGSAAFSERWGHTPNEWSRLLAPDNIVRTYEGYGFDPDQIPEKDPFLEQTGVWMIDEVSYGTDGIIRVTMRDLGRVLSDQIIFPPVVPEKFYPLSFEKTDTKPGVTPGQTTTRVITTGGEYDEKHPPPAGWTGPTNPPEIAGLQSGDGKFTVRVSPPNRQFGSAYAIVGYQAVIDGVRLPKVYSIPEPKALIDARAAEDTTARALAKIPRSTGGATETQSAALDAAKRRLEAAERRAIQPYLPPTRTAVDASAALRRIAAATSVAGAVAAFNETLGQIYGVTMQARTSSGTYAGLYRYGAVTSAHLAKVKRTVTGISKALAYYPRAFVRGLTFNVIHLVAGIDPIGKMRDGSAFSDGPDLWIDLGAMPSEAYSVRTLHHELAHSYRQSDAAYWGPLGAPLPAAWRAQNPPGTRYGAAGRHRQDAPVGFATNYGLVSEDEDFAEIAALLFDPQETLARRLNDDQYLRGKVEILIARWSRLGMTVFDAATAADELLAADRAVKGALTALPSGSRYEAAAKAAHDARTRRIELQNAHNNTSATFTVDGLTNGNVYFVEFCAVYRATGATGKAGAGQTVAGSRSNGLWAHPAAGGGADISPGSLKVNTDADGNQNAGETHLGRLTWMHRGTGQPISWRVIYYRTVKGRYERQVEYYDSPATPNGSSQVVTFQTPRTKPGNTLTDWNILVYGYGARSFGGERVSGAGAAHFRSTGGSGEFYLPPVTGAAPQGTGASTGTTSVLQFALDTSSEKPAERHPAHPPAHAFDKNPATYWQSPGHATPSRPSDMEWVQAQAKGETLVGVRFTTRDTGYQAYISVFAYGQWIAFDPDDVIPYRAAADEDHGGRIPYVYATTALQREGPHTVRFKAPIPGVTKVRLTLRNLQLDGATYVAAVRDLVGIGGAVAAGSGPVQDTTSPTTVATYTTTVPPKIVMGAGGDPGKYADYTDIVKLLCAWGGFYWPYGSRTVLSDGSTVTTTFPRVAVHGLTLAGDPVLGEGAGRVWGDLENTGTAGPAPLKSDVWDKRSLLDGIVHVREIIGFLFHIDETGGVVWKMPNIFRVGNDVATLSREPRRTQEVVTLDERESLISVSVKVSGRNLRERIFISNTDGTAAALAQGYNPNRIGLRRVAGWTDQNFKSDKEALRMADRIAIAQLLTYRENTVQIPAYPRIQINDQVRIFEEITNEGYLHYVRSISSSNDLETGEWLYSLGTQWLGTAPFEYWVFHPDNLSDELRKLLDELGLTPPKPTPPKPDPKSRKINSRGVKVSMYVRVDGNPQVYITDGITRRPIRDETERIALSVAGLVPTPKVQIISQSLMDRIPVVAEDKTGL